MSRSVPTPLDDERPPSLWWSMWKRFLIGAALIVIVSGAATAAVALNTANKVAGDLFNKLNQVAAPKGLVKAPEYEGAPATYLILGSDRRAASKDSLDRTDPPHSDTILLVRFDPSQGQTSVLSIPRDLLVNIKASTGQYYPQEKINAAYTYGAMLGGVRGSMLLAAETIKHEVFPGLELNGIIDVNFKGFIQVVDTLGCVYVNVDHRYYHVNTGGLEENYSEINLQPGYQKLCYNNALSYVRYRHGDSDFVRVARQQDFLRDLREQISPTDVAGQLDKVAKAVGHAIVTSGFNSSADQLFELAKLIGFSQSKPLRQVKFRAGNANAAIKGGSYVTSTPELERATLEDFLHGEQKVSAPKPAATPSSHASSSHGHRHHQSSAPSAVSIGLYPTPSTGDDELVKESVKVPFRVLYPGLETGTAVQQPARAYALRDNDNHLRHAYIVPFQQNGLGGYYDFEGSDWLNPPLVAHPSETRKIGHTDYRLFADGSHIHMIAWREGKVLYWVVNTLLEDLTNEQMLGIARSAQSLH